MLQGKLKESRNKMALVSQNKKKEEKNQSDVKKNNTFFDAYTKSFVPIIQGYVNCKKCVHVIFSKKTEEEFKKLIADSKEILENKVVTAPQKYKHRVEKLKESMISEWKTQTEDYLTNIKDELGILKLVSNDKQEIQKILSSMNRFSEWPSEADFSKEFDEAIIRAKDILLHMEFDDDIANFLRKVKDRSASLLDLTDPIINWIRKENLSANIMLSIKN